MNYQQLLESLGQKLALLTQSRAEAVTSMLAPEGQAQQRIADLNLQLIEIGVALTATARAANADLRTP